jgi:DNA-binding MarR family transcriptional regulator
VSASGAELSLPELHALVRALAHTSVQHALFTQAVAARLGIGPSDFDCLALLFDLGPATPTQVADVLGLTTGAVTGLVDRLVSAGFVLRDSDPADRRRVIVRPVAERKPDFESAQAPLVEAVSSSLAAASPGDLQRLLDFHHSVAELVQRDTSRIRGEHSSRAAASGYTAPLGDLQVGELEFASGAAALRIRTLDPSPDVEPEQRLYSASFEGSQPSVRVHSGTVTFRYRRMGPFEWGIARHAGVVALNASIPWTIAVRGGASTVSLDASGLLLRELSISGGANNLEVCLPPPSGTVRLCFEGGVSRVKLQYPRDIAVELQLHGGANRLDFDARHFGAVGGDVRLANPKWDMTTNRYTIEVRGGASRLSIQELSAEEGLSRAHDIW